MSTSISTYHPWVVALPLKFQHDVLFDNESVLRTSCSIRVVTITREIHNYNGTSLKSILLSISVSMTELGVEKYL